MNQQWTPPVPISKLPPLPNELIVGPTTVPVVAPDDLNPEILKTYGITLDQLIEALSNPIPTMYTLANLGPTTAAPIGHSIPGPFKQALQLVKADVGLGNVDNTTDTAKPVSTAQQAALDLKAPLASPVFTGTPVAPTAAPGTDNSQIATTEFVSDAVAIVVAGGIADDSISNAKLVEAPANTVKANLTASPANPTDAPLSSLKASMGLENVNNTSDAAKPISTATQTALNAKLNTARPNVIKSTTDYTLALGDDQLLVLMNSNAPQNLTIPAEAVVPFPLGTWIPVLQYGTGTVTVIGAAGVTLETGEPYTLTRWRLVWLFKRGTDVWRIFNSAVPASETVAGIVELASAAEMAALASSTVAVTPFGLSGIAASTTQRGIIEIATEAETLALNDATRCVTPSQLDALVASEGQRGIIRCATTAEITALTLGGVAVTPDTLGELVASTTQRGISRFATTSETLAGTATTVGVTPAGLASMSGTWSPATAATVNLDNAPAGLGGEYIRIGDVVSFSVAFNVNPTAAVLTSFYFSCPVATNFGTTTGAHGTVTGITAAGTAESGSIESVVGASNLKVEFMANSTANHKVSINGHFRVL